MEEDKLLRLKYRRQYLIAPGETQCPFIHRQIRLTRSHDLFVHPDLPVATYSNGNTTLVLLGDMFDYLSDAGNEQILKNIIHTDFYRVVKNSFRCTGKFVLLFIQDENIRLFHDATAMRKIFYSKSRGCTYFASQPHILARILSLAETDIPSKKQYYHSEIFTKLHHAHVGVETMYDEVRQLKPGHFFDLASEKIIRFWPLLPVLSQDMPDAALHCAGMLKGYLGSIIKRYPVMLPVTGGKDSRTLMAATRPHKGQVYYYLNRERHLHDHSNDVNIPQNLLSQLHIPFHLVYPYPRVDDDFRNAYFETNPYASSVNLPVIYNYFLKFEKKVNLPGNIAFEPFFRYKFQHIKPTGASLAKINQTPFLFAEEYFAKWLSETAEIAHDANLHILYLFYIEERLSNQHGQFQSDKEIAQEEFNPFNSIELIEKFLGIDYRKMMPPDYFFHRMIIRRLWPELLTDPINPSGVNTIKKVLSQLGLLNLIYRF
jgi:hypothetical protein